MVAPNSMYPVPKALMNPVSDLKNPTPDPQSPPIGKYQKEVFLEHLQTDRDLLSERLKLSERLLELARTFSFAPPPRSNDGVVNDRLMNSELLKFMKFLQHPAIEREERIPDSVSRGFREYPDFTGLQLMLDGLAMPLLYNSKPLVFERYNSRTLQSVVRNKMNSGLGTPEYSKTLLLERKILEAFLSDKIPVTKENSKALLTPYYQPKEMMGPPSPTETPLSRTIPLPQTPTGIPMGKFSEPIDMQSLLTDRHLNQLLKLPPKQRKAYLKDQLEHIDQRLKLTEIAQKLNDGISLTYEDKILLRPVQAKVVKEFEQIRDDLNGEIGDVDRKIKGVKSGIRPDLRPKMPAWGRLSPSQFQLGGELVVPLLKDGSPIGRFEPLEGLEKTSSFSPKEEPALPSTNLPKWKPALNLDEASAWGKNYGIRVIDETLYPVTLTQINQVNAQVAKIPEHILLQIVANNSGIDVLNGRSVADHPEFRKYRNERPRGWNKDDTWKIVPGAGGAKNRPAIIVANSLFSGHGCVNLVLHEHGHTFDAVNNLSASREWLRIFNSTGWSDYEGSHREEAFAESFAKYFHSSKTRESLPLPIREYMERVTAPPKKN